MQTDTNELLAIARRYCSLIESLDEGNRQPLYQLNEILPRLHAAMTAVPSKDDGFFDAQVDLDQRFELFSRLRRMLGAETNIAHAPSGLRRHPRPPGDERQSGR